MFTFLFEIDNPHRTRATKMAEIVFKEMDLNGDNKVTKDEFVTACLKNNHICTMLCSKILEIAGSDC